MAERVSWPADGVAVTSPSEPQLVLYRMTHMVVLGTLTMATDVPDEMHAGDDACAATETTTAAASTATKVLNRARIQGGEREKIASTVSLLGQTWPGDLAKCSSRLGPGVIVASTDVQPV